MDDYGEVAGVAVEETSVGFAEGVVDAAGVVDGVDGAQHGRAEIAARAGGKHDVFAKNLGLAIGADASSRRIVANRVGGLRPCIDIDGAREDEVLRLAAERAHEALGVGRKKADHVDHAVPVFAGLHRSFEVGESFAVSLDGPHTGSGGPVDYCLTAIKVSNAVAAIEQQLGDRSADLSSAADEQDLHEMFK